ncbi:MULTISPECIES: hypothetical protein [unclassified Nocardioides]|uniref:hypothetical protein n=1 Tax=unclassified Nocardioides TaxID=2615069 RepID=UPI0030149DD7
MDVSEDLLAQIWASLEETGVWVAPEAAAEVSAEELAELESAVAEVPTPTYVVVQPDLDDFAGEPAELLTQLHDRYDADGLYLAPQFYGGLDRLNLTDRAWGTEVDPWQALAVARARHTDDDGRVDDLGAYLVEAAELLTDDALPQAYEDEVASRSSTSTPSSGDGRGDDPVGGTLVGVALGLVVVAAVVGALRRRRRPRAFALPSSVVAQVREAQADRLEQEARSGLLVLGDAIRTHDLDPGDDSQAWQAALDHYDAAARVLDTGGSDLGVLDAVGAVVLVRRGRAALDAATAGKPYRPVAGCYLNPLHAPPTRKRTRLVQDGHTGDVPLCPDCRADLKAGRAPDALRVDRGGKAVLYVDSGVEPWASTAYGALGGDLVGALHRLR